MITFFFIEIMREITQEFYGLGAMTCYIIHALLVIFILSLDLLEKPVIK